MILISTRYEFTYSSCTPSVYHRIIFQVAYNGISYLDESDKIILQRQLNDKTLYDNIERAYKEQDDLRDHINKVSHWLKETKENFEESMVIQTPTPVLKYLTHKELRNRFSNLWTISGEKSVIINTIRSIFVSFSRKLDYVLPGPSH